MNIEFTVIGILFLLLIIILIYQLARIQNTLKQMFEVEAHKLKIIARRDLFDIALNISETFELSKPLHSLINNISKRIDKNEND